MNHWTNIMRMAARVRKYCNDFSRIKEYNRNEHLVRCLASSFKINCNLSLNQMDSFNWVLAVLWLSFSVNIGPWIQSIIFRKRSTFQRYICGTTTNGLNDVCHTHVIRYIEPFQMQSRITSRIKCIDPTVCARHLFHNILTCVWFGSCEA